MVRYVTAKLRWFAVPALLLSVSVSGIGCLDSIVKTPLMAASKSVARIQGATCTQCGACMTACPEGAISEHIVENNPVYIIDPEACTGCGICIGTCDVRAIEKAVYYAE